MTGMPGSEMSNQAGTMVKVPNHSGGRISKMTENLVAGAEFYSAIGLRRGVDWEVSRLSDGTPVAKCLTAEAFDKASNAMDSAVSVLSGGWWAAE
jgi:hypothetical protein